MKALSTTILIVVTAVVILVAALVLLTIFGGGIQNVATITQAQSICLSNAQISCTTSDGKQMPSTWYVPNMRIAGGSPQSCADVFNNNCNDCDKVKEGCK
ncbi:MAG: hypothetical protein QW286_00945 [Candidatus Aenigmatarchaeota archaeon]